MNCCREDDGWSREIPSLPDQYCGDSRRVIEAVRGITRRQCVCDQRNLAFV